MGTHHVTGRAGTGFLRQRLNTGRCHDGIIRRLRPDRSRFAANSLLLKCLPAPATPVLGDVLVTRRVTACAHGARHPAGARWLNVASASTERLLRLPVLPEGKGHVHDLLFFVVLRWW